MARRRCGRAGSSPQDDPAETVDAGEEEGRVDRDQRAPPREIARGEAQEPGKGDVTEAEATAQGRPPGPAGGRRARARLRDERSPQRRPVPRGQRGEPQLTEQDWISGTVRPCGSRWTSGSTQAGPRRPWRNRGRRVRGRIRSGPKRHASSPHSTASVAATPTPERGGPGRSRGRVGSRASRDASRAPTDAAPRHDRAARTTTESVGSRPRSRVGPGRLSPSQRELAASASAIASTGAGRPVMSGPARSLGAGA